MSIPEADAGSFRDPGGQVYVLGQRVFRTVMPVATDDFEYVESTGVISHLADQGWMLGHQQVDSCGLGELAAGAKYVLEQPKLDHISYPYEWSFPALKAAALLHLDVHLKVLEYGVTLSDASAFNIQFSGTKPVFIDTLSFRRYIDGEFWMGHRQFCEQFLNPLLLRAILGIPHNGWYRGTQEGITAADLNRLLPWTKKISWNILTHVVMQASFQKSGKSEAASAINKKRKLPLEAFKRILLGLRAYISKLEPADTGNTVWADYAHSNSYTPDETRKKQEMIAEFVRKSQSRMIWDIGCNTGDYSVVALEAGAEISIGFDFDQQALELGFARAQSNQLNFQSVFLDAANPVPNQGWAESERKGMRSRAAADGMLALALIHHLAIARNIPLARVVSWLLEMAPQGIIEFVPKNDPMVQDLLRLRKDIFHNYTIEHFLECIRSQAEVVQSVTVSNSGRELVWFRRNQ